MSNHHESPRHLMRQPLKRKQIHVDPSSLNNETSSRGYEFFEDRKGDSGNLTYGSLERASVPRYRTAGSGRLVGLDSRYKIVTSTETRREISDGWNDSSRTRTKGSLLSFSTLSSETKVKKSSQPQHASDHLLDYIKLKGDSRNGSKNKETFSLLQEFRESVKDGSGTISESETDESDKSDPDDPFEVFRNDTNQILQRELLQATEKNPRNDKAWLDLIAHQDRLNSLSPAEGQKWTLESRNTTEMKISLYEKALSNVVNIAGRERLTIGLMREGSKIWDSQRQSKEWMQRIQNESSLVLWELYINFQQTNFTNFAVENCLNVYGQFLAQVLTRSSSLDRDEWCVYILLRITMFMRQSGYVERAIAIWQTLLEFNFSGSNVPSSPQEFREFWDSEAARIGEPGASGWKSGSAAIPETKVDSPALPIDKNHLFDSWVKAEQQMSRAHGLPARALDDVAEEDPYRVIISSDIQDFIISVPAEEGQKTLLNGFLHFCGLPFFCPMGALRKWITDPFTSREFSSIHSSNTNSLGFGLQPDIDTMFSGIESIFHPWASPESSYGVDTDFALNVLQQLVQRCTENDPLVEYLVAYKNTSDAKGARKLAKSLLKKRSSSMRLYNVYALIECSLGNFDAAETVWATALQMSNTLGQYAITESTILLRSWVLQCMSRRLFQKAQALLLTTGENSADFEKFTQSTPDSDNNSTEKYQAAESYLFEHLSQSISRQETDNIVVYTDLLALLKYLADGLSIETLLSVYQYTFAALSVPSKRFSAALELVHQSLARALYFHTTQSGVEFKPGEILSIIETSKELFPTNILFSSLFSAFQRRCGIIDRLYGKKQSAPTFSHTPNITPVFQDIINELNRPAYSGSTNHSIRAAFDRAISNNSDAKSCVPVWKAYIEWESSLIPDNSGATYRYQSSRRRKEHDPAKRATETYHAALRACPWAKELYMLGFANDKLRVVLGDEVLGSIYRTMIERGLRIRVDISDILDRMVKEH